jgi:hypothetical protein
MSATKIQYHPVLASVTASNRPGSPEPEPVLKLSGYVGPASAQGLVRLYTALDDVSHYLEFDGAGVVHTADTPDSEMPDNACSLWVKAGTQVRWSREFPNVVALFAYIKSIMTPPSGTGGSAP